MRHNGSYHKAPSARAGEKPFSPRQTSGGNPIGLVPRTYSIGRRSGCGDQVCTTLRLYKIRSASLVSGSVACRVLGAVQSSPARGLLLSSAASAYSFVIDASSASSKAVTTSYLTVGQVSEPSVPLATIIIDTTKHLTLCAQYCCRCWCNFPSDAMSSSIPGQ